VTLIAAFRQQETPVLVGDFLVTANGAERGSRKKICRIAENFAIGWTGNLVVAEKVVSELRNSLAGTKVSVADVEGLLTVKAPDSFGALHVHLIGWILGPPDVCFLWNSQWPQQLFEAPYHYDGTGGPSFIKQAGEGGGGSLPGVAGVRIVLYPVTLLMMNEITSRTNRAQGFGYGYEILYGVESKFEYLDDLTWIFAQARFSAAGKHLATQGVIRFYSYRALGELSVLQLHEDAGMKRDVIEPPYAVDETEVRAVIERMARPDQMPAIGSRLCLAMDLVRDADTPNPRSISPLIITRWPGEPNPEVDARFEPGEGGVRGTYQLTLPRAERLEWIFAKMIADPDLNGIKAGGYVTLRDVRLGDN